jgi:hypothetical protein
MARAKGGPKPGLLYTGVGVSWVGLPSFSAAPTARIGLRKEVGPVGLRLRIDYASASGVQDQWLRYDYQFTGGALAALYPVNRGRILLEAGLEGGYGYAQQTLPDRRTFSSGVATAAAAFMLTAPVGPVRLGLDATMGGQLMKLNDQRTVKPAASVAFLALYGF